MEINYVFYAMETDLLFLSEDKDLNEPEVMFTVGADTKNKSITLASTTNYIYIGEL